MRKLLAEPLSPVDAEASLRVIAAFDDCLSDGGTLEDLVGLSSALLGCQVTVRDDLNDRLIGRTPTPCSGVAPHGAGEFAAAVAAGTTRGRHAVPLTVLGEDVLAVTLDHSGGRLGVAWAPARERESPVPDELVLERLARAAVSRILQDRESARPREPGRADAVARLLAGDLSADMVGSLCRRARIDGQQPHRVVVLSGRPAGVSPEVLLARALTSFATSVEVSSCVIGGAAALLLPDTPVAIGSLQRAAEPTEPGTHLMVAVSRAHAVGDLPLALLEARRVAALSDFAGCGLERAEDIGALLLLAALPAGAVRTDEDVQRAVALLEPQGQLEVALLETYCATGSLRKTAELHYVHHSTVAYHLKRLEQGLGFGVSSRSEQVRALLAVKLARLVCAGLLPERGVSPTTVGRDGPDLRRSPDDARGPAS